MKDIRFLHKSPHTSCLLIASVNEVSVGVVGANFGQ